MGKRALICSLFVLCLLLLYSPGPCRGLAFPGSPGKLGNVYAGLHGEKSCVQCHTEEKKPEPAKCLVCHKELALRIKSGTGFHKDKITPIAPIVTPQMIGESIYDEKNVQYKIMVILFVLPGLLVPYDRGDQ